MAACLMRKVADDAVEVYSAGTKPGDAVNALSAQSLAEVGVDISGETPTLIDPAVVRDVDLVVTLGREAHVDPVPGTRFENWDTDEPSERASDVPRTTRQPRTGAVQQRGRRTEAAVAPRGLRSRWRRCRRRPGPGTWVRIRGEGWPGRRRSLDPGRWSRRSVRP